MVRTYFVANESNTRGEMSARAVVVASAVAVVEFEQCVFTKLHRATFWTAAAQQTRSGRICAGCPQCTRQARRRRVEAVVGFESACHTQSAVGSRLAAGVVRPCAAQAAFRCVACTERLGLCVPAGQDVETEESAGQ